MYPLPNKLLTECRHGLVCAEGVRTPPPPPINTQIYSLHKHTSTPPIHIQPPPPKHTQIHPHTHTNTLPPNTHNVIITSIHGVPQIILTPVFSGL